MDDFAATSIAEYQYQQDVEGKQHAGDDKLRVWFKNGSRLNNSKSLAAGRAVFEDVPFVVIRIPGDKTFIKEGKAWIDEPAPGHIPNPNAHNIRFKKQWDAFKAGQSEDSIGTPLKLWPQASPAFVDTCASGGVKTVEQLASLSDANLGFLHGGDLWRKKARDWLAHAKDSSHVVQMRAEIEKRDAEKAAQDERIAQLEAALKKLSADSVSNTNQETQSKRNTGR